MALAKHFIPVCSKFNSKKYFTGDVLEVAQQIEKQIASQLPSMLQVGEVVCHVYKKFHNRNLLIKFLKKLA